MYVCFCCLIWFFVIIFMVVFGWVELGVGWDIFVLVVRFGVGFVGGFLFEFGFIDLDLGLGLDWFLGGVCFISFVKFVVFDVLMMGFFLVGVGLMLVFVLGLDLDLVVGVMIGGEFVGVVGLVVGCVVEGGDLVWVFCFWDRNLVNLL